MLISCSIHFSVLLSHLSRPIGLEGVHNPPWFQMTAIITTEVCQRMIPNPNFSAARWLHTCSTKFLFQKLTATSSISLGFNTQYLVLCCGCCHKNETVIDPVGFHLVPGEKWSDHLKPYEGYWSSQTMRDIPMRTWLHHLLMARLHTSLDTSKMPSWIFCKIFAAVFTKACTKLP